jgi:ABC-2 type transport system permease protein
MPTMVRKLIRFELLLSRKALLIMLGIFAPFFIWAAAYLPSARFYIVMTSFFIGLSLPAGVHGREDKFKTTALLCSLPARRSSIVLAKFAASWLIMAAGFLFAIAVLAVFPLAKVPVGEFLKAREVLLALGLTSLGFALVLPFIIRFGITGLLIGLAVAQLLGVLLFTSLLVFGRETNPVRSVARVVIEGLRSLFHRDATPGYLAVLVAAVIIINAASFFVARALYLRREL